MAKALIGLGFLLIVIGLLWNFAAKIPWLGRLPGDIFIQKKNFTFYFPIVTLLLISVGISFILWLLSRR